jgi:hypothetical protein
MIVAGELVVRIERDLDLPLHFEASPLRTPVKVVGWPVAILATVGGVALFVKAGSMAVEAVAACLVVFGCASIVLLVRCRRYQVTVGERMTELSLGPFRRTLPTGCVTGATERPSISWRRLYAPHEVVLALSIDTRPVIVPTHEPDELRASLKPNPA